MEGVPGSLKIFKESRDCLVKMYEDSVTKLNLFTLEQIESKRLLKRLWAVINLEIKNREEVLIFHGKNSVSAREHYFSTIDFYFKLLKLIFSKIY